MLNPETKTKIHQAIEGMGRDEVVEQIAASVHASADPEKLAAYLVYMQEEESGNPGNPGNPY